MRTTVTNLAISSIRGKKRMWTLIDESGVTRDVRAESPHVSSERREDLSRVAAALERLDPDKRAMIMLRVHEGLSYEAIATHLGVPIGTVMSRLNRARLALLGELEHTHEPSAERPSEFNINRARGRTQARDHAKPSPPPSPPHSPSHSLKEHHELPTRQHHR